MHVITSSTVKVNLLLFFETILLSILCLISLNPDLPEFEENSLSYYLPRLVAISQSLLKPSKLTGVCLFIPLISLSSVHKLRALLEIAFLLSIKCNTQRDVMV